MSNLNWAIDDQYSPLDPIDTPFYRDIRQWIQTISVQINW